MFVPSNNSSVIYRCKTCAKIKIYHINYHNNNYHNNNLICDVCEDQMKAGISIESGGEANGLPNVDLLLGAYYKRDIKISFSSDMVKFSQNYTVVMIPNKDNWLNEKIEESQNKLKLVGLKDVSFKMMGEFSEMEDYEISLYMNDKTFNMRLSPNSYSTVDLPMVLKVRHENRIRTMWSRSGLLDIFILLLSAFITLSCIGIVIYALYNSKYPGLIFIPMATLSGSLTYKIFRELF